MITFEKKNKYGDFEDLMGMTIETGDKWLDKKLNSNLCYGGLLGGGGGGGGQQDVPPTLRPYVTDVLNRAKGLYGSNVGYVPYQGERIVGFSPQEQAAMGGIQSLVGRGLTQSPYLTDASSYYGPAYDLLSSGALTQQQASGLLGQIDPTLRTAGSEFDLASASLAGVPAALSEQQQRILSAEQTLGRVDPELEAQRQELAASRQTLGRATGQLGRQASGIAGAQQTLAGVSPELAEYRARLSRAEEALGATAPTLGQFERQLRQAEQTYGGAQERLGRAEQQLGRAEQAARAGAGGVGIGGLDVARYMDPYQQQVIDIEKRQARQDAAQTAQAIGAKAAGMGGFGGSRQAILEAQQASDLGSRLSDIQTRGSQAAYDRALQTAAQQQQLQYGEDVARLQRQSGLGQALASLASSQAGIGQQQAGIGQQQAGLGISGYGGLAQAGRDYASQIAGLGGQYGQIGQQIGSLAGQQGQLAGQFGNVASGLGSVAGQQQGIASQFSGIGQQIGGLSDRQLGIGSSFGQIGSQLGALSGQRAALGQGRMGLGGAYGTGAGAFGQQAGGLSALGSAFANLGQGALGQGYREMGYLSGVGEQDRALQQQRADLAYGQFREERDFPSEQLQRYSSLIQGFPMQGFQMPVPQPSGFQQAAGGIAAIGGLGRGLGFFNKGGDIGKGGLAGIVNKQEGGPIRTSSTPISNLRNILSSYKTRFANTDLKELEDLVDKNTPGASRSLKEYQRMLDIEKEISLKEEAIKKTTEAGISRKDYNAMNYDNGLRGISDAGFDAASGLESEIEKGTLTSAQAQAVNLGAITPAQAQTAAGVTPTSMGSAGAAGVSPIGANVVKTAEDVTGLQAILDKAFAFDKAAEEKAIKQQQGFDVAALGLQLMSTPLNQIDPALIRNLGVTNKELAGLDEKGAKKLLQKKLTELEIKKAEKELGSVDLVPLFPGIDDYVENLAQTKELGQIAGVKRNELINAAQSAASIRASQGGHDPDSAMAERYLREELDKQADIFKNLVRSGTGDNAGRPAAGDVAPTLSQLSLRDS